MKKFLLAGIIVVVAGIVIFFFTPAYRHLMAGRLLKGAESERAKNHYAEAERFYRLAIGRDPSNPKVLHEYADFLDTTGRQDVLAVRLRIVQVDPADAAAVLDAAEAALKFRRITIARRLLANPSAAMQALPRYYDLQGWLQYLSYDLATADAVWTTALGKNPGNKIYEANLAMVRLGSSDEAVRKEASGKLTEIALGDAPTLSALSSLMVYASQSATEPAKLDQLLERFHSLVPPENSFYTSYLDALRRWRPELFKKTFAEYMVQTAPLPEAAMTAQSWMVKSGLYEEFLKFRESLAEPLRENLQSLMLEADALFGLKRTSELEELLKQPVWTHVPVVKMAIEERIRRASQPSDAGHAFDAQKWNAILAAADKNDAMLTMLTRMAFIWGWQEEYALTLWASADANSSAAPDTLENLFQFYLRTKNTRGFHRVLARQMALQPDDPGVQNNYAFVSFLLGTDTAKAMKISRELYANHPGMPLYTSTLAFGLLKTGKPEEGLELFKGLDAKQLRGTGPGVCYGYLLAATGDPHAAEYLEGAEKWAGFPEEIEMIQQARKQAGKQ